jgi:hypothetical protein
MNEQKMYVISEQSLMALIEYLDNRPHKEVYQALGHLKLLKTVEEHMKPAVVEPLKEA